MPPVERRTVCASSDAADAGHVSDAERLMANTAAVDNTSRFADAFRLQHLKARMVEGSQFQMQDDDMARLVSFTLALAADASVVREAVSSSALAILSINHREG